MIKNFEELKNKATLLKNSRLANRNNTERGTYSFGIVNNKNGKRISISKLLAKTLNLTDHVDIVALEEDNIILLGKSLPFDEVKVTCKLSGDDKKIIYNSQLVHNLSEIFSIDYKGQTSRAFSEISIHADNNTVMAAVIIK